MNTRGQRIALGSELGKSSMLHQETSFDLRGGWEAEKRLSQVVMGLGLGLRI